MQSVLLFLSFSLLNYCSPEQVAFDYFAKNVVKDRYPEAKAIYFSGHSEPLKATSAIFIGCFKSVSLEIFLRNHKGVPSKPVSIAYQQLKLFKQRKKPRIKKLYLEIYKTVEDSKFTYTYIKVYKINNFVDHYLVKSSVATKEVIDICQKSEII